VRDEATQIGAVNVRRLISYMAFALMLLTGLVGGLSLTWLVVTRTDGFGVVTVGPWQVAVRQGAIDADPYSRAIVAHRGEVPMSQADGLALVARVDSSGEPLTATCSYRVQGRFAPARHWTLTAYDPAGTVHAPTGAGGLSSSQVLFGPGGELEVMISSEVAAGNWLPIANATRFLLVLRLYDTPFSAGTAAVASMPAPSIQRVRCKS
jgi:hypothetical protein